MNPEPHQSLPHTAWLLLIPVVALLSSVYLPFVNTTRLWFGLPALVVWTSFWVAMITPTLWLVERTSLRDNADEDAG